MKQSTKDRLTMGAAILAFASATVVMEGCAQLNSASSKILQTLAQIGNTAQADAAQAKAVALAATPPDTDGATCWTGVSTAIGEIQQVNTAANAGQSKAGVFTAAEMASLFQPGSAQYNQVVNLVGTACIAKANDVMGAANVVGAGGVMAILPQIIPLAAAGA